MTTERSCPCDPRRLYAQCCEPLHRGREHARTAERLMRSRYSAYALGEVDYLVETLHSSQREPDLRASLRRSAERMQWRRLEVLRASAGGESDVEGTVDFWAAYVDLETGAVDRLYERSSFVREQERWYYVSGVFEELPPLPKARRNDPCWCGSGKKHKKCHG